MDQPFPSDIQRAAPYRGKRLRVITIDLNNPLPPEAEGAKPVTSFALHPSMGISAVNERGQFLTNGTLIVICEKGGD